MKKLPNIVLFLAVCMITLLYGCGNSDIPVESQVTQTDDKPSTWMVGGNPRWKEVITGEIDAKVIRRSQKCNSWPSCRLTCLAHESYGDITFKNGKTYSIGQIRDYELIDKGQYGTLYKYNV